MSESDDFRRKLANHCFRRSNESMFHGQWQKAREYAQKSVSLVPDNLLFHQYLMGITQKFYHNNQTGAPDSEQRLTDIKRTVQDLSIRSRWDKLIENCLAGLDLNPWDAWLNAQLGNAARDLDWLDIAIFYYEQAVKNDRANQEYTRNLKHLYRVRDDYIGPDEAGCPVPA